ncbi:MAG: hypothetical protein JJV98_21205, partial [Desulfosarcina sp.]|nr:hypothetical protein [Desulfobacterales bacterium]
VTITPADLLGNGTACLVWSSPLPDDIRRPMRYVNLMGSQKPHLLIKTVNNLGVETHVHYAPSTKFYLQDKHDGTPWITRLPFPVHVVERVETYDRISRNRFATRYAYHHGYFDGIEREFRGFGMVEQWDSEEFAALTQSQDFPTGDNIEQSSHVPPVWTRTWFHTGAYFGRLHISNFFAGLLDANDIGEYYREPGLTGDQARKLLLKDTVLPDDLTAGEEREACRALKGAMLRQEIYALDGTDKEPHPYTVTEQNFTIRCLQARTDNRYGVFFTHAREAINYHYERNPTDPRITHAMTLEVDDFGNVLKETAIGYGRRTGCSPLSGDDKNKQEQLLVTYTENSVTHAINGTVDNYRTPLPCQTRTYELTGFKPKNDTRFSFNEWTGNDFALLTSAVEIPYEQTADKAKKQKRLIEHVRTLYRKNNLSALLPPGVVESLAFPGKSYQLAFTPGLAKQIYVGSGKLTAAEMNNVFADDGKYVHSEDDTNWWIPSGQVFCSPNKNDTPAQELAYAHQHFLLPCRFRDPFHTNAVSTESFVSYDSYDMLVQETRDALGNRTTVGERHADPTQSLVRHGHDYRVLQPRLIMGPNRNLSEVMFDALGMVVGTAVTGKPHQAPVEGDSLVDFKTDLSQDQVNGFHDADNPHLLAANLLKGASTRIIYDLDRFQKTKEAHPEDPTKWSPAYAATLARETHVNNPLAPDGLKIQLSFSYSDGFGREIQQKIQAEPEKINGVAGPPRWVGSGWTIFNNKGKPVRQYEPFFDETHKFRFGKKVGVSPILFYDPAERVVATLHPN